MLVGGATVTIGRAIPAYDLVQPAPDQPVHVAITWFGDDVDAAFARAVEAGAEVSSPPADQFHGDRTAVVRDPFGHRWVLATQLEVVPYAEQQRRLDEMMSQASGSS
jgi:PhnB protein